MSFGPESPERRFGITITRVIESRKQKAIQVSINASVSTPEPKIEVKTTSVQVGISPEKDLRRRKQLWEAAGLKAASIDRIAADNSIIAVYSSPVAKGERPSGWHHNIAKKAGPGFLQTVMREKGSFS